MTRKTLRDAARAEVRTITPIEATDPTEAPQGPERPQTELTRRVTVYSDPDQWRVATAEAASDGRSYSRLVHDLVGEWLSGHDD